MNGAERLADAWAGALHEWAIPPEIMGAAPESPYGFPTELFVRRAEHSADAARPPTPTTTRALEALGTGGTVLDVGVGAGATSLPLAERCTGLIAVDGQPDLLAEAARAAGEMGVPVTPIEGRWPGVAAETPAADVAVCGHVAYNAPDLDNFLIAMSQHARARVVMELTDHHPWSWMNDLWSRFHGSERPAGPSADDAEQLCRALGFAVRREDRVDGAETAGGGFERREDAIGLVRRRLCVPSERDGEIAAALGTRLRERDGLWSAGPPEQRVVTLWWDTGAKGPPL